MKTLSALILLALCVSVQADNIPDLTPEKVKAAFGDLAFKDSGPRYSNEQTERELRIQGEESLLTITLFGPPNDEQHIKVISACVSTYTEDEMAERLRNVFMGLAASVRYTGSKSEEARQWVAANINKGGEKLFGGVKFRLSGSGQARILRISMDAPEKPEAAPVMQKIETILPEAGRTFADVVREHGKPTIRDTDTGWAIWPGFKVRFKDGVVVEASKS